MSSGLGFVLMRRTKVMMTRALSLDPNLLASIRSSDQVLRTRPTYSLLKSTNRDVVDLVGRRQLNETLGLATSDSIAA